MPKEPSSELRQIEVSINKVDASLGLVFATAIVCKIDGEPYYDLGSVDDEGIAHADHISTDEMMTAVTEFMISARTTKAMHQGDANGVVVHSWPFTAETAAAFGDPPPRIEGWRVAFKPDPETFAKYVSGEYTGTSIGGRAERRKEKP